MTPKVRSIVQAALSNAEDNLYRFKLAARGSNPGDMWGESGQTLAQFIASNQSEVDELKRELGGPSTRGEPP